MPVTIQMPPCCDPQTSAPLTASQLAQVNEAVMAKAGWAQYSDTQYTSAAPFSIVAGVKTHVPNNAGSTIESFAPDGVVMYDPITGSLTPNDIGDGVNITINFKVISSQANTGIDFAIDIGGTIGDIFPRSFRANESAGIEKQISFSFSGYTLGTWKANGGKVNLTSEHAIKIYDINYIKGIYAPAL